MATNFQNAAGIIHQLPCRVAEFNNLHISYFYTLNIRNKSIETNLNSNKFAALWHKNPTENLSA